MYSYRTWRTTKLATTDHGYQKYILIIKVEMPCLDIGDSGMSADHQAGTTVSR